MHFNSPSPISSPKYRPNIPAFTILGLKFDSSPTRPISRKVKSQILSFTLALARNSLALAIKIQTIIFTDVFPHPIDAVTEQRLSALRLQAMDDYSEDALPTNKKTMYYTLRALVA